jgi:hypothetical protein
MAGQPGKDGGDQDGLIGPGCDESSPSPSLPRGLCGNRGDHEPHEVLIGSLAPFFCEADQRKREPYASERRR